jgi:magnesium transporter
MLMAVCHTSEGGWTRVDDLQSLSDLRASAGHVLWAEADVTTLDEEDIRLIAEEFDLHELAVEDAIHTRQRPKYETYDGHLFAVFHELVEEDRQFEARQIACFIGERYVLVLHEGAQRVLEMAKERFRRDDRTLDSPSYLVYTMLDSVVDDYQNKADAVEAEVEELEEVVLAAPDAQVQRQIYSIKQRLARLRRYVLPGERLLNRVLDPAHEQQFSEETRRLFTDVHDHLLRMTDQVRNSDDLAAAMLDLVRGEQGNALNEVNKRLAAWAAIFGAGTLIAGIYGMNFALVPEDQTLFGFWFAVGLMVLTSLLLYYNFKRRDWL